MPRLRRRPKSRAAAYGENHVEQLKHGHDVFLDAFGNGDDFNEEAARTAWGILRDKIMVGWILASPGTRPWGWWAFDAPAPGRRERIDGSVHPHDNKKRSLHVAASDSKTFWRSAYRLSFGLPACFILPFDAGITRESYEPEWEYLVRHNLLLPDDSP